MRHPRNRSGPRPYRAMWCRQRPHHTTRSGWGPTVQPTIYKRRLRCRSQTRRPRRLGVLQSTPAASIPEPGAAIALTTGTHASPPHARCTGRELYTRRITRSHYIPHADRELLEHDRSTRCHPELWLNVLELGAPPKGRPWETSERGPVTRPVLHLPPRTWRHEAAGASLVCRPGLAPRSPRIPM